MKSAALVLLFSASFALHAAAPTDPRGLTRRIAPLVTPPPRAPLPQAAAPRPSASGATNSAAAPVDEADQKRLEFQKKKAEEGADYAQYELGIRYLNGNGVEKNPEIAKQWLEKAAKNGSSAAKKKLDEIKLEEKYQVK